ncbi:hypothetical protein COOONC_02885 [Cooperia oncophora]
MSIKSIGTHIGISPDSVTAYAKEIRRRRKKNHLRIRFLDERVPRTAAEVCDRGPVHSTRSSPGQQPTQCHLQSTLCPLRYSSLKVVARELVVCNAYDIMSPAMLINSGSVSYVSRI